MAQPIVVLVTAASKQEAERISQLLLEKRMAVCVNILPGVSSQYWWQGKIESAEETMLVIKSDSALLDDLTRSVRDTHSYDVPEVIAIPIVGGNPAYLEWLGREAHERKG